MNIGFKLTGAAAALGLALGSLTASAGTVTSKGKDLEIDTTGGFKVRTTDDEFSFNLGGRIMWDVDHYDGAFNTAGLPARKQGDAVTSNNLRRARIELKGTVYTDWEYIFAYNLSNGADDGANNAGESSINDAGIAYKGWKGHKFFIGRGKEPFGLEELTSSKWISTPERSMFWDSTDVDSQSEWGLRYDGYGGMFTWQVGIFDTGVASTSGNDSTAKTGRITIAPVAEDGNVVHFGVAMSQRARAGRSESDLINPSAGISDIGGNNGLRVNLAPADSDDDLLGLEALWISGPFSLQAEYFNRDIDVGTVGAMDQEVDAWYLQGTYTLTGESRGYKKNAGVADKIKPKGKRGAIELVLKYDSIEADTGSALTAAGSSKPEVDAITLGANWYVNKNIKFALTYTDTSSDNVVAAGLDDSGDAILLRTQIAF